MSIREAADRAFRTSGLDLVVGRPSAIVQDRRQKRQASSARGLDFVMHAVTLAACDDAPLILASPSWRSGSTLLQRLANSTDSYFIWGEPYAHAHTIERLVEGLSAFSRRYPREHYMWGTAHAEPLDTNSWTANLFPGLKQWFEAQRIWFQAALAVPPEVRHRQWGLKTVRLDATSVRYLQWLFPNARVIVLIRDPVDAYTSYARCASWYERFPDRQIRTASQFGAMWAQRTASLLTLHDDPRTLFVDYEALADGGAFERIERFLGVTFDRRVADVRVAGVSRPRQALRRLERLMIIGRTRRVMDHLGDVRDALEERPSHAPAGARIQ